MLESISEMNLTVAVPTFGREAVLIETLGFLLAALPPQADLLVIDQTPQHEPSTIEGLDSFTKTGRLRILHQQASIPKAMNRALVDSTSDIVLFVDDDVIPSPDLINEHFKAHAEPGIVAVVGQVLQPGEEPQAIEHARSSKNVLTKDLEFCFRSTIPAYVSNVMAGNLSVKREVALSIGGFDENFVGVAYRFETDFAKRLTCQGKILYCPTASIRHLKAPRGGTRTWGSFLNSSRPEHSVGDYYYARKHASPTTAFRYSMRRMIRSILTRYHLTHPWWIPSRLLGEIRGCLWASQLHRQGPQDAHRSTKAVPT